MTKARRLQQKEKQRSRSQVRSTGSTTVVSCRQTAERAVRAMALALRAMVEIGLAIGAPGASPEQAAQSRDNLNDMLSHHGLFRVFNAAEAEALERPAGEWSQEQRNHYAMEHEVAATLCWVLGMTGELTHHDEISPVHLLSPMYSAILGRADEFFEFAALRPKEEIEMQRDILMLWCARANIAVARWHGLLIPPDLGSWDAAASQLASYAAELRFITPLGEDFPASGKPFRELSQQESTDLLSALSKRYEVLCWLTGEEPAWERAMKKTLVN